MTGESNYVIILSMNLWEEYFKATRIQNWKKAIDILNQIKETETENPQVFLKIGDIYQKIGNIEKAIPAYLQAAWLLLREGFLQKALAVYKIILRLDPNNSEAINRTREILVEIESAKLKQDIPQTQNLTPQEKTREGSIPPEAPFEDLIVRTSYAEETPYPVAEVIPEFLKSLHEEEIKRIMNQVKVLSFQTGDVVVTEGDSGTSVYVIKSGRAKVTTHILGKRIELAILEKGDFFGEVAFLTGRLRTATVTAIEPLDVFEFTGLFLEKLIERHPSILERLQDFYYSRLQNTIKKSKA